MSPGTTQAARRRRRLFRSPWAHAVLALILVSLIQGFLLKVYQVPSGSMEQTLNVGDRVLVNRTAFAFTEPQRGDVTVFRKPATWGPVPEHGLVRTAVGWFGEVTGIGPGNTEHVVKRLIGVPGDTVECCGSGGQVTVNGEAIAEPYVFEDLPFDPGNLDCTTAVASPRCFGPIRLGEDQFLLLGDHRSNSDDSVAACRSAAAEIDCVKTAGRSDLVGTVSWFLFPFEKWGGSDNLTMKWGRTDE